MYAYASKQIGMPINLSHNPTMSCIKNAIHEILVTCLALYPKRRALSGRVGLVTRTIEGCWRYSQQRTLCTNLIKSDCFFLHISDWYL